FSYPAPEEGTEPFVQRVAAEAQREPGTLVLPMTERTALPLSIHREQLLNVRARIVFPAQEAVMRCFDKLETTRLACSLGIATPHTLLVFDAGEARRAAENFSFPAVLKPRSSFEAFSSSRIRATGRPVYARNAKEFLAAFNDLSPRCGEVLA